MKSFSTVVLFLGLVSFITVGCSEPTSSSGSVVKTTQVRSIAGFSTQHWLADVNGDGRTDVVYSNNDNSTLSIRFSTVSGSLDGTSITLAYSMFGKVLNPQLDKIYFVDLNNDGAADLLDVQGSVSYVYYATKNQATPFDLTPDRTLGFGYTQMTSPPKLNFKDLDGDGINDIFSTGTNSLSVSFSSAQFSTLTTLTAFGTSIVPATNVLVGDFNGDGIADVLLFQDQSSGLYFGNKFTKSFDYKKNLPIGKGGSANYQVQLGDFNGDGRTDLFQTGPGGSSWIGLSDQSGYPNVWTAMINTGRWDGVNDYKFLLGDLNGDGKTDIYQIGHGSNSYIGLSDPNTGIPAIWSFITTTGDQNYYYTQEFGKFNQDARADLLQTSQDDIVYISLATQSGNWGMNSGTYFPWAFYY
jgi:hypothetical protein